MFYIQKTACISPQQNLLPHSEADMHQPVNNKLQAIEPEYPLIPPSLLRRMGKAVRLGVGAALPLLNEGPKPNGLIIGTGNGGLEDCIKFLNQIIEYKEGTLTPTNFVQSTPNAIASQLGLLTENNGYNVTHVHRGLAFENAALDAAMMLKENPGNSYLLGGVEEISAYNYNINHLGGWYKKEPVSNNNNLYTDDSPGSIAGEGAAIFTVNATSKNAIAHVKNISTLHGQNIETVKEKACDFLKESLSESQSVDLFISGENGDKRLMAYYDAVEQITGKDLPIVRLKHLTGEFETVSALAVFMACQILNAQGVPPTVLKHPTPISKIDNILIYNTSKGYQHSFILVSKV